MSDIVDPKHEVFVEHLFGRACAVLGMRGFELKPMRRRLRGRGKFRSFTYGYTRIGKKSLTIDLYTPKTMKPRKTDAILRVICHELAHHREPPRVVLYRGRRMRMIHHPAFWRAYKENVSCVAADEVLGEYF
jgi:hypothetical protein